MAKENEITNTNTPFDPVEFAKAIAEGIRQGKIDPEMEARKERDRIRLRAERERSEKSRKAKMDACTHLREDNTSTVAWMRNSDEVTRGVCQRCNKLFVPGDPDYDRVVRISTGRAGVIYG